MPRRLQTELMTSGAVPGARVLAVVRRWPPVRGEAGAVTIEFVVIFPLILLILAFIAFVSFAIAAQSEVQQVAFERTRFGMLLAQDPGESGVHAEGVGAGEPDLGQQRHLGPVAAVKELTPRPRPRRQAP